MSSEVSTRKRRSSSLTQTNLQFQLVKKHKPEGKTCTSPAMSHYVGVTRPSGFGGMSHGLANKPRKVHAKKLIVKNFAAPVVDAEQLDIMWRRLQSAVADIHQTRPTSTNLESLYKDVEDLCIHRNPHDLYVSLKQEITCYIRSCSGVFGDGHHLLDKTGFLRKLAQIWDSHCKQTIMIRNIFLYLERNFALKNPAISALWDMGTAIFREIMMNTNNLVAKCVEGVLSIIQQERQGDVVDRCLLSSILSMLRSLGMYVTNFETPFLRLTDQFYLAEGQNHANNSSVPVYLAYIKRRLSEEEDRILHYLGGSTKKRLISSLEQNLIGLHIKLLLEKGFDSMLDEKRHDDLAMLYNLLSRTKEGNYQMCEFLDDYIKKRGLEIVMTPEKDKSMVQDLLLFKDSIDFVIEDSFKGVSCFVDVKKKAFEEFINKRQNKPAELIAKFIDGKLRSGNKEQSEEELEDMLDKVMVIFRFIQGKDVFEAFYKKDLAKRLLMSKSASVDSEKSMLSKLKQECGSQFTFKLEGMFKDIDISKDLLMAYRDKISGDSLVDLSVNVLTTGYWPTYTVDTLLIPSHLSEILDKFKTYYLGKHSGRKLVWHHSLSFCTLKVTFGNSTDSTEKKLELKKELSVSFYQGLVLLLFNSQNKHSFKEILESSGIEENELCRVLQSLACGKTRVLRKKPLGKDIAKSDDFEFNKEFRHKLCKIKINQIQMKETKDEHHSTTEKVFQDRQYLIDAVIVRIMKTRKTMMHSVLVSELYEQLKFPVKPIDLKKRIENLIERDYMERSKNEKNVYHYVA